MTDETAAGERLLIIEVDPVHGDGYRITDGARVTLWADHLINGDGIVTRQTVEITDAGGAHEASILPEQIPALIAALKRVERHLR